MTKYQTKAWCVANSNEWIDHNYERAGDSAGCWFATEKEAIQHMENYLDRIKNDGNTLQSYIDSIFVEEFEAEEGEEFEVLSGGDLSFKE